MKGLLVLCFCSALYSTVFAQTQYQPPETDTTTKIYKWELGALLGEPTVASIKYWFDKRFAVDAAVGWSFINNGKLTAYGDVHYTIWYGRFSTGLMPVYAGAGPVLMVGNGKPIFGVRVVGGVEYMLRNAPISLFGEIAPRIELTDDTNFGIGGGIGARWIFGS